MNRIFISLICAVFFTGCSGDNGKTILATGTIEATEITVSAQSGGQVKQIITDEGRTVSTGDTLLIIDNTDWRYQLEQARGGYEMAESQYRLALKGAREEDIIQAEANYNNAEADLKRMEELYRVKTITEKQLDDARTRFTVSQQNLEKVRHGSRREEIEIARARRDQAKGIFNSLQKKFNDCTVTAPISGTITERFIEKGELAGTGSVLFRISDLSSVDITIYVTEVELPKVQLNQKAIVTVDAFPDRKYEGKVVFISSNAEFTPKNIQTKDERTKLVFSVKVKVPNPDSTLKAGIPADVVLHVADK